MFLVHFILEKQRGILRTSFKGIGALMKAAIIADKITKQYKLGQFKGNEMLREAVMNFMKNPFGARQSNREILEALSDISFAIQPGEVVGIIGRNGAGKSTLLKVLSRITSPTSGNIKVKGRLAALLEVGTGFHEELTGRENIYLNGSILGMKKHEINTRLDEIVAFSEVERFLDTPIKRYSSGMRLRLGFAVAAHLEPEILLVDEVLAVGDVGFQKKCLDTMSDLQSGGRTVLFVSHNLAAVENLCPRAIWIDRGCVREDGDARSVIQSYLSTFAQVDQSVVDLRQLDDRRGTGDIQFTRIELLDSFENPIDVVRSGDALIFRLHYEAFKPIKYPQFGIDIHTNMGTLVTSVNTWTTGFNLEAIDKGEGFVDVRIDSLNFIPDRYYLSLWLTGVGRECYDRLEHCAALDIEAADVYKAGRQMTSNFGIIYLPCNWTHQHDYSMMLPPAQAAVGVG